MPKYSGARARAAAREVPVSPLAKPMVTKQGRGQKEDEE